jgi:GTP-binding protein EngB required for normal cell division
MNTNTAPLRALADFEKLKFELADLVRIARAYAHEDGQGQLERAYNELQSRLAEDRFHLGVVGRFSRGKSTLMNAILGMDRLPTGLLPMTSVITSVSYGSRYRVVLHFEDSILTQEVPLADLAKYVTEEGNPGNRNRIEVAEVQLPAEILRRGFYFIDTPGFGSARRANTETARSFLTKADALLFVTSFEAAMSSEELAVYCEARGCVPHIFLVVNKMDLVSHEEREQVLQFIRRQTAARTEDDLRLFCVSAREGLSAKLAGRPEALEQSGLTALESSLADFLTTKKSQDFLTLNCNRLATLLEQHNHPELQTVRQRLQALQESAGLGPALRQSAWAEATLELEASAPRGLEMEPCVVCQQVLDDAFQFLSRYQYELTRDHEAQLDHAGRSGFCPMHTWQYARLTSPQAIAMAYPKVLLSVGRRLRELSRGQSLLGGVAEEVQGILPGRAKCKACQVASDSEVRAVREAAFALNGEGRQGEHEFPSLCLPHLRLVLPYLCFTETVQQLLRHEASTCEYVGESLQRFALKKEGLRKELMSEEEVRAPGAALELLAGHRNVQPAPDDEKQDSQAHGPASSGC